MPSRTSRSLYLQSPRMNQLNILREVAGSARITQSELAGRCSLSVAMVNNYMQGMCGRGLLRYNRKSAKNVTYHLTDKGARHAARLEAELLEEMARMFAEARDRIRDRIAGRDGTVPRRVVLYGTGRLAELALCALEPAGVQVLAVCDHAAAPGVDFCGRPVVPPSRIRSLAPDAVVVAADPKPGETLRSLETLPQLGIGLVYLDGASARGPSRPPADSPGADTLADTEPDGDGVAEPLPAPSAP